MDNPPDPVMKLASSEVVDTPDVMPAGKETVLFATAGAGLGAAIAGPVGAVIGGTVGWAMDTLRRKLISPA